MKLKINLEFCFEPYTVIMHVSIFLILLTISWHSSPNLMCLYTSTKWGGWAQE